MKKFLVSIASFALPIIGALVYCLQKEKDKELAEIAAIFGCIGFLFAATLTMVNWIF